jgi:dehydrogenase/reductase SDR family member 12
MSLASAARRRLADLVDASLELPVVPSYTSIGPFVRRRIDDWTSVSSYDASGRTMVVTGATSGIGRAAARHLAEIGATVVVVGRDRAKTGRVLDELRSETGSSTITSAVADIGDLGQVRALAEDLRSRHDRIDVLVHNAGALDEHRHITADGIEATVASQVVGPFLLTDLLLDRLHDPLSPGRVITMSSGGMYSQALTVDDLQMGETDYRGTTQYARAKRAQVTLNEMWAARTPGRGVVFHAMHPGWADTPGVQQSLPRFRTIMRPFLRDADAGAETLVWLAVDDGDPLNANGAFWLDRRQRGIHILPTTKRSDTPHRRAQLWDWVSASAGTPDAPSIS